MIGSTIGHYRIESKLGEGQMGVVYRAADTRLNRPFALKFLPSHVTEVEKVWERFLQEARAAAALNHPNIRTICDIETVSNASILAKRGEETGKEFIVLSGPNPNTSWRP